MFYVCRKSSATSPRMKWKFWNTLPATGSLKCSIQKPQGNVIPSFIPSFIPSVIPSDNSELTRKDSVSN